MANHAPTTAAVVPHPAADAHRTRTLRRERNKPHRERLEAKITAALEQLEDLRQAFIARLDALAGDCDLEDPGDLEPSLAFPERCYRTDHVLHTGSSGDREEVCEGEGEQCEDEGAATGDDEPDSDNEGGAQATCYTETGVWPPKFDAARPYGQEAL